MKTAIKLFGFIATVAIITFSMAGCKNEPEPAHVHDYQWSVTTAATCTEAGLETGVCALDATHTTTRAIDIDPDAHVWDEWDVTAPATCIDEGERTRECTLCHADDPDTVIPIDTVNGHDYQLSPTATAPTCTEPGNGERICSYDNTHTITGEIPIDDDAHDWGNWTETRAPTCSLAGENTRTCSYNTAGHKETQVGNPIVATAHNYAWVQTSAPTCSAKGVDTETCTYNTAHTGTTREGAAIDATAHNWGIWSQTRAPTCSLAGEDTRTCSYNTTGHKETRAGAAINPNAHNWNNNYTLTDPATCSAEGTETDTCSLNPTDHTRTRPIAIDPDAHEWETKTIAATESKNGIQNGEVCKHDDKHRQGGTILYATGSTGFQYNYADDGSGHQNYSIYATSNTNPSGNVVIPAYSPYGPVVDIGRGISGNGPAFGGTSGAPNTAVISITFAEGSQLKTISNSAFFYCTALASVKLPDSLTTIGDSAFSGCSSLTSVTIGNSVTSIGQAAFNNCTALTSVTIGNGVTSIGNFAFSSCTALTSVTLPESVTSIGNSAFSQCAALTGITIPNSVTSIGQAAFNNCSGLTSITIPASVTSIGMAAFNNCTGLTSVTFAGTIASGEFGSTSPFPGDLRDKFYADNSANGTPGTYIVTSGTGDNKVWERQQ